VVRDGGLGRNRDLEQVTDRLRVGAGIAGHCQCNSLANKLAVEEKVLFDLRIERAVAEVGRRTVEADLGPVRYLATLIGQPDEAVLRWFTLVVALLLDPAGVLLLLAATRALAQDGRRGAKPFGRPGAPRHPIRKAYGRGSGRLLVRDLGPFSRTRAFTLAGSTARGPVLRSRGLPEAAAITGRCRLPARPHLY
jgi:hypothetical protein